MPPRSPRNPPSSLFSDPLSDAFGSLLSHGPCLTTFLWCSLMGEYKPIKAPEPPIMSIVMAPFSHGRMERTPLEPPIMSIDGRMETEGRKPPWGPSRKGPSKAFVCPPKHSFTFFPWSPSRKGPSSAPHFCDPSSPIPPPSSQYDRGDGGDSFFRFLGFHG
jgi:hypothetical protein